jgi:glycosyltransferase involved in cell wall biosynthesis
MRILMLAQFYWPDVGGEERHAQDLAEAMAQRGHQVAVATLAQKDLPEFEVLNGVRIYRIRASIQRASFLYTTARTHFAPIPDPEAMAGLRRVVAKEQPQIVHAHNWLLHAFTPIKQWSKAKFVVSLHDLSMACAKKTLMQGDAVCDGPGLLKCLSCAKDQYGPLKGAVTVLGNMGMSIPERAAVDMFLPVSTDTAERNGLLKHKLPHQVVPNFVPDAMATDDWGQVGEEGAAGLDHPALKQLPQENYIMFAGDVRRFKGAHILLEAYARLQHAPPLVLAGRLNLDVPAVFPPNVIALDRVPHNVLMEVRRRSLFAVAPSVGAEPFGIVIIEAMAMGQPVIASCIGGIPDVVADGETGLLVPPGNVQALQHAMQRLIDDPPLRASMGAAAKRRVARFRASAVTQQIEDVYQRLVTKTNP